MAEVLELRAVRPLTLTGLGRYRQPAHKMGSTAMHRVHFRKENITFDVPDGTNLRHACIDAGIDPYPVLGGLVSCRGKGFCGTCAVGVDEPTNLSAPSRREARYLKRLVSDLPVELRLSCQAAVHGPSR